MHKMAHFQHAIHFQTTTMAAVSCCLLTSSKNEHQWRLAAISPGIYGAWPDFQWLDRRNHMDLLCSRKFWELSSQMHGI